jgi:lysophospholipase L1-like esterase
MRIAWSLPLALGALGVLAAAPGASATPYLNLEQATADVKSIVASGGQADIVLIGDSLSYGPDIAPFGDSPAPAGGSFRPAFTQKLQQVYGNAGAGFVGFAESRGSFGNGWTSGVVGKSDPAPHSGLDGQWLTAAGTRPPPSGGNLIAFNDRFELHYVAQPFAGRLSLSRAADGVPMATLPLRSATRQVRTFTYQFPSPDFYSGVHFQPHGAGPVTLLGWNRINDNPGVRVHRASNGGWGVDQFLQRDWTFDQELQRLNTDLVMVAVGTNDASIPADQYVPKLGQLVDRIEAAVPDSEIILVAPYDIGGNAAEIANSIEQVAAGKHVGFINLYEIAGSHAFFEQNGYLSDGLHFTTAGGNYVGGLLASAFRNNGIGVQGNAAAALPEPGAAVLLIGAGAAMMRRRRPK